MNGRRLILMVLLIAAAILPAAGPAAAQATRAEFTATETWVEDISLGKEWYSGPNDKIYNEREGRSRYDVVATDPRVSGVEIITVNLDMKLVDDPDVYFAGTMHGTFHIENDGGTWEGLWTGVRDERGFSYIEYVGSGGGGYAGLQMRVHNQRLTPDWTVPHIWTGYILDPGQ